MKKNLPILYGQARDLSTSFQTRELARHLEPWFQIEHLELPHRSQITRVYRNFIKPAFSRPKTDFVLYGNDGFADLRHWRARRILYWYDAPADWSKTPPTSFKDHLRCANVRHAHNVFCVSAAQVRVAKSLRPGHEVTVQYLPVGVDCEFFDPAKINRVLARQRLGFSPEHVVIGYLGYLGRWQNRFAGEALLEAAPAVALENVRFLVIGAGPALADWKSKVAGLGLQNRFTFTGYIPNADLPSALAATDICIDTLEPGFHSEARSETKLKQYMAMARACVATNIGENKVDLDEGRAGVLTAANSNSLAEGIRALIANPTERECLGQAARRRAVEIYAWPVLAQKLVSALRLSEDALSR